MTPLCPCHVQVSAEKCRLAGSGAGRLGALSLGCLMNPEVDVQGFFNTAKAPTNHPETRAPQKALDS